MSGRKLYGNWERAGAGGEGSCRGAEGVGSWKGGYLKGWGAGR